MTKTSPARISATVLLLSLFLGMIAFASMHPVAGGSTTSAFAAQNTNKSGATMSAKKPSTKTDCSKADDAALAAQIKGRLSKRASLKDIDVVVKAGVATLTGKVRYNSHRIAAAAEAKKVKCVKRVVNNVCKAGGCPPLEFCCNGACQTQPCTPDTKKP
ncbi:MAG: BON domain-containing protein [Acidobacteriota bacterium]